ncbi:hypothetical protein LguiA_025698 [Lonicera macranthoides]
MVVSRLSYVEIVKNCELNKEDLMRGKQPADTMYVRGFIEWKRVVVCSRESVWDSWRSIQNSLNKFYKTNFQLKPFLTDKAMFLCKCEEETEMYGSKGLVFLSGPFAIRLQRWEEESIYQNRKIACTGGWINIQGLPVAWWNEKVFKKIGERCGGLIEIDKRTSEFQNLLVARIKVRGNHNGFIQALMQVQLDSCSNPFIVRLSSTSKLDLRQRSPKEYLMSMKQYKGNYQNLEDILIISDTEQGYFDNKKEEGLQSELEKGEGSRSMINEGGLHETRKDQIIVKKVLFADQIQEHAEVEVPEDSDYGISSFGDVASSEGTIIGETQEVVRKEGDGSSHCNLSLGTNKEAEWVMNGPRKFVKGQVEEHLVQGDGTKLKGWNRLKKSKLTRLKWSPKPIQTYKRRKKDCRATLRASDGEDSDKEAMIEDKWAEILLGNKQIDNNYLEDDVEFMSDGDNMEMTDDEATQAYEATSKSNDEYVSNSEESENEISNDQNSLNHYDGNLGWCGYLFYEEDKALGSSNILVTDKQDFVEGRSDISRTPNKQRHILVHGSRGAEKLEDSYATVREIVTEVDEDRAKIPIRNEEGVVASKSATEIHSETATPTQGLVTAARELDNSERWFGLSEVDKEKFCGILEEMGITMYATKGKEKKYAKEGRSDPCICLVDAIKTNLNLSIYFSKTKQDKFDINLLNCSDYAFSNNNLSQKERNIVE